MFKIFLSLFLFNQQTNKLEKPETEVEPESEPKTGKPKINHKNLFQKLLEEIMLIEGVP